MSLTSYRAAPPRVTMIELSAGARDAPGLFFACGTVLACALRDMIGGIGFGAPCPGLPVIFLFTALRFEDLAMTYSPTP